MLYGTLQRALPLIEGDGDLRRQALSLAALCEDRLHIPRRRPTHAERRGRSEEERYGHE